MSDLSQVGKLFLVLGATMILFGGLFMLMDRVPWIGQLPGDFQLEYDHVKIYIPLATMLILSVILTLLMNLLFR